MERVLEPELMDDGRRAEAYARADFSESNQLFVNLVVSDYAGLKLAVERVSERHMLIRGRIV
jgi:hypothetical protein